MILAINDNTRLADLQDKFSECFPHLKIEFYSYPHHWKAQSSPREQIDPIMKVGEVSTKHEHGVLEIKSAYQTGRVEQDFHNKFGLNVQIFRYVDGNWVQSTGSDNLTLKEQQGKAHDVVTLQEVDTDPSDELDI